MHFQHLFYFQDFFLTFFLIILNKHLEFIYIQGFQTLFCHLYYFKLLFYNLIYHFHQKD